MPRFAPAAGSQSLLDERKTTHGDYAKNARISQAIKLIMREEADDDMPDICRESLEMIALKMSRILSGHWNYADHWDDISGYAKLASEACEE